MPDSKKVDLLREALRGLVDPMDNQWRDVHIQFRAEGDTARISRVIVDVVSLAGRYNELDVRVDEIPADTRAMASPTIGEGPFDPQAEGGYVDIVLTPRPRKTTI